MILKSAKVEIKKEHQLLMVNKTTSFKKRAKGKKGNFKKDGKLVATPMKKPKARPKPGTECFYCKGNGHWKWNCPRYLADKKDGIVNNGILDIWIYILLMCTLLVFIATPRYLILVQLLRVVTRNMSCKINRD